MRKCGLSLPVSGSHATSYEYGNCIEGRQFTRGLGENLQERKIYREKEINRGKEISRDREINKGIPKSRGLTKSEASTKTGSGLQNSSAS